MDKARLQHIVFALVGIIFLLLCAVALDWPLGEDLWTPFLLSIATVFLGVGLVYLLWRLLGGAPSDKVCRLADSLRDTGVSWFWLSRIETIAERKERYQQLLEKPKVVDLMGFNLTTEIFRTADIRERIARAVNDRKASVRVLILEPDVETSTIAQLRLNEPGEPKGDRAVLPELLREAEQGLRDICARLTEPGRKRFLDRVRFADESMIRCMIVRIDEEMFVGNYLTSTVGNDTPGMQIRRRRGGLFEKYHLEFEQAWNCGRELTDEERNRLASV